MKKKRMSKIVSAILLGTSAVAIAMASGCGEVKHNWKWDSDAESHWQYCTDDGCDEKTEKKPHVDANNDYKCDDCARDLPKPHEHAYTEWKNNDEQHWKVCPADGAIDESTKADHDFANGNCECGKEKPHEHAYEWVKTDAKEHWKACPADGAIDESTRADHDFTNGNCECGRENPETHEHAYTKWANNDEEHWKVCPNDDAEGEGTRAAHDFTNGDCICGKEKPHEHAYTEWANNDDEHWKICPVDGEINEDTKANHDFTNGNCVCGKVKTVFTVIFDAGEGTLAEGEETATTVGGKLASLPTPTEPADKKFVGWFTAATDGIKVTTATAFTADTTIYAHYKDRVADGVYVGENKLEAATIAVNTGNPAEIVISGVVVEEETTIKIAYDGEYIGINAAKSGGDGAQYLDDGVSIKLEAGEYTFYYTFLSTSADYQKIWTSKKVEAPDEDKNEGLNYVEGFGAEGVYLVGKYKSKGMSDYGWGDGFEMTETAESGVYTITIYLYVGDQIKARVGNGDGSGHNVWKQEAGVYNYNGGNCNIEKEGYFTATIDTSAGNNNYELKVTYIGESLPEE